MKTNAILAGLLVSGLIGLSGCGGQSAAPTTPKSDEPKTSQSAPVTPPETASADPAAPADSTNLIYVKLNVPNMT